MGKDVSEAEAQTLGEAREAITTYLKDSPLAAHAAAILDFVGERGDEPFGMGEAVEATGGADIGEVLATLSHLSQGRWPALVRSIVFIGADGDRHTVEGNIHGYLDGAPYTHPTTGEIVPDALGRMYFQFEPMPGLLQDSNTGPTP